VRQRVVASLGSLSPPTREIREIAQEVENRIRGIQSLIPLKPSVAKWADMIIGGEDATEAFCSAPTNRQDIRHPPLGAPRY